MIKCIIKIVDKSIGKAKHSPKQVRHEEALCDAVTTKDKSKIEHQFLLAHEVNKVNMNIQYQSIIFSIFFLT
jgi:hypothetical protein